MNRSLLDGRWPPIRYFRAGDAAHSSRTRRLSLKLAWTISFVLVLVSPIVAPIAAQSDWTPPSTVYLPETGHTLDRLFLDQWRDGGGASAYGYPITPEITQENGHIVQYLEYARFEYWPEGNSDGDVVIVADIGWELRPLNRQLTILDGNEQSAELVTDSIEIMSAWLPVTRESIPPSALFMEQSRHSIDRGFREFWERTGGEVYLGLPLTEEYIVDGVTYQVFERGQLSWQPGKDPWMVPVGRFLANRYNVDQQPVAQGQIPTYSEDLFIPPSQPDLSDDTGPGPIPGTSKSIVVSISQQRMWAYEGNTVVLTSLVSTGRPGFDTPTGQFSISKKVEMQDMEGLIGGEYYNVADVPDVMYFTAVGHAFHGTYWHSNFGAVMSHGCVNLPLDIAASLYDWTPMYTPVLIVP